MWRDDWLWQYVRKKEQGKSIYAIVEPNKAIRDGVLKEVRNKELHPMGLQVFQDKEAPITWGTITEIADTMFAF